MVKKARHVRRRKAVAGSKALPSGNHLRVVFDSARIHRRVQELSRQINRDYEGKTVHVVGILENCILFMADLIRLLRPPVVCHFVKAEMHDQPTGGTSVREIVFTPKVDVADKDILLVDGILQSGVTLDHLVQMMLAQKARSVRTALLIDKTDERKVDVPTDYVGFKTTSKFLVGYGLGYQEKYRNLPSVARLEK
jgi:hypoxanthine phosphoribosyltransferase